MKSLALIYWSSTLSFSISSFESLELSNKRSSYLTQLSQPLIVSPICNLDLSLGEELEDKEDDDSTDSKLDTLFSPVIF